MRYLLSSYGLGNPYILTDIPDHAVYPIGVEGQDFIDLDYSLLLVGTGFLFDQQALDYLLAQRSRLRFLAPLVESILKLKAEGLLETFDGKAIIEQSIDKIREKTERLCEDIVGWLGPVRAQWSVLKADRETFLQKFGSQEKRTINEHHFSVVNAAMKIDGALNPTLVRAITRIINSKRKTFTAKEAVYVKEVLRPLVCHTVIQDLFRCKTKGAVLDWDDSQPYYERLYAARWDSQEDHLLAYHARSLFTLSLPQLRPKNVDGVIRFIRNNKNVESLRADITAVLARGEKFDAELGRRLLAEVLEHELGVKKKMKRFRFLGALASVFVPGGSLLTEAAVEGGSMVGEDAVEAALGRAHRWLYSLRA